MKALATFDQGLGDAAGSAVLFPWRSRSSSCPVHVPADSGDFCACMATRALPAADRQAGLKLLHTMVGALHELGRYRADFDSRRRYIDLFPMVYWHTTSIELRRLAEGEFVYPLEKLRQLLIFYDAYKVNRDRWDATATAEGHWQRHFLAAAAADLEFGGVARGRALETPAAIKHVLMSGFSAHIDYDLPRTLRQSFRLSNGQTLASFELRRDFLSTAVTLRAASKSASNQVTKAVRRISSWGPLLRVVASLLAPQTIEQLYSAVIKMRNDAWTLAASGAPVPTGSVPSPVSDHSQLEHQGVVACGRRRCGSNQSPI